MNFKQISQRTWGNDDRSVNIFLPCDKRTYRLTDVNGNMLTPKTFRSLEAAAAYAEHL